MKLDNDLIIHLRQLATSGHGPCELLTILGQWLSIEGTSYRLVAIAYFKEAFGLSLPDAMRIGAAPVFPGENRSREDVDAEIGGLMAATRQVWVQEGDALS